MKALKKILAVVGILLLLTITCSGLGTLKATELRNPQTALMASTAPDVVIVGSSHAYRSFIPQLLYDEFGLAAMNYAAPNQSVTQSYWAIKELLHNNKPRMIVLEAYLTNEDNINTFATRKFDTFSLNKIPMVLDTYNAENHWMVYDRFMSFRTDETPLTYGDYNALMGNDITSFMLGYRLYTDVKKLTSKQRDEALNDAYTSNTDTIKYFESILKMVKTAGVDMVVCVVPYLYSSGHLEVYKQMAELAREYGYPFINYATEMDEIGISLETDFADSSHINHNGALKITRMLGEYLTSNYNLPERRGNAQYSRWQNGQYSYQAQEMTKRLRSQKTLEGYLRQLQKADESIAISIVTSGDMFSKLNEKTIEEFKKLSFDDLLMKREPFAALRIGKTWVEKNETTILRYNDKGVSYILKPEKHKAICIGGRYLSKDNMLLNIVVSSRIGDEIYSAACLAVTNEEIVFQTWTP